MHMNEEERAARDAGQMVYKDYEALKKRLDVPNGCFIEVEDDGGRSYHCEGCKAWGNGPERLVLTVRTEQGGHVCNDYDIEEAARVYPDRENYPEKFTHWSTTPVRIYNNDRTRGGYYDVDPAHSRFDYERGCLVLRMKTRAKKGLVSSVAELAYTFRLTEPRPDDLLAVSTPDGAVVLISSMEVREDAATERPAVVLRHTEHEPLVRVSDFWKLAGGLIKKSGAYAIYYEDINGVSLPIDAYNVGWRMLTQWPAGYGEPGRRVVVLRCWQRTKEDDERAREAWEAQAAVDGMKKWPEAGSECEGKEQGKEQKDNEDGDV